MEELLEMLEELSLGMYYLCLLIFFGINTFVIEHQVALAKEQTAKAAVLVDVEKLKSVGLIDEKDELQIRQYVLLFVCCLFVCCC